MTTVTIKSMFCKVYVSWCFCSIKYYRKLYCNVNLELGGFCFGKIPNLFVVSESLGC